MNRTSILLLTLGPLLVPGGAAHGSATGFIQARLVISAACQISSNEAQPATLANPGLLDFGERGPNWDQPLRSRVDEAGGEGSLQISCTPKCVHSTCASMVACMVTTAFVASATAAT